MLTSIVVVAEACWRAFVPLSDRERLLHEFVGTSLRLLAPCARVVEEDGAAWILNEMGGAWSAERLPLVRPAGALRVVVVGESSGEDFAKALVRVVEDPGVAALEVIDCASAGAAIEHVERRIDEAFAYGPDALVVVAGHNLDFLYPLEEETLHAVARPPWSRLVAGLRARVRPPPRVVDVDSQVRLRRFEALLRVTAVRTRERSVLFAAAVVPTNLFVPPVPSPDDRLSASRAATNWLGVVGDAQTALARFDTLGVRDGSARSAFAQGIWRLRLGEVAAARQQLEQAIVAQRGPRDRATRAVAEVVRSVARREGFAVIDAAGIAEQHARFGLPGWDVMLDHCHLQPWLWDEAARGWLREVGQWELSPSPVAVDPDRQRVLNNLLYADGTASSADPFAPVGLAVERWLDDDAEGTTFDLSDFTSGDVFQAAPEERQERILVGAAWGYWHHGLRGDAHAWNRRAQLLGRAAGLLQAGLFAVAEGDYVMARDAFERARGRDGGAHDAEHYIEMLDRHSATTDAS